MHSEEDLIDILIRGKNDETRLAGFTISGTKFAKIERDWDAKKDRFV
jgi:hypothetical protein